MKKTLGKLCCLLLSLTTLFSTACVSLSPSGTLAPPSFNGNYGGNYGGGYGGSNGDSSSSTSEESTEDSAEEETSEDDNNEELPEEFLPTQPIEPDVPGPEEPDPAKTVLSTETDALGHEIVTYTDGTWEDLGRVVPLDFSTPAPTEQYGYEYFGKQANGSGMQDLYAALYDIATKFHNSANELTITGTGTNKTCQVASFTLTDYGVTQAQAEAVWRIFANENPAFFWIDNKISSSSTRLVLLANYEYAKVSARTSAQTAIMEMALDCDRYINGKMTESVLATTIQDYLAGRIEYAYKGDGSTPETALWAHNLVGAATKNKGVCETYAKTYDYLCTLFDLDCLTVTGKGITDGYGVGHAWNVIELDGEWYDVDVTWNDVGGKEISREWFGKEASEFAENHIERTPQDGWDLNFQYTLPTRCNKSLNLVKYGKYESEEYTLAGSMQAAFDGMTDSGKEYEVYLYPHTLASEALGLAIDNRGGAEEVKFPEVTTISLYGTYTEYGDGTYTLSEFTFKGDNVLTCHLVLNDVSLSGGSLDNRGYIIATMGTMAIVNMPIQRTAGVESVVWAQATKATLLNGYVDTWALQLAADSEVRLCGGGEIEGAYVEEATLCCYGANDVSFDYLEFYDDLSRLYIAKTTKNTKITIGELDGNEDYTTIAVAFDSTVNYPSISVNSASCALRVHLYSTLSPATAIQMGNGSASVTVYQLNASDELVKAPYETDSNGNVNYVG